jgi:ATP-binding cassette subfamily B protein
MPRMVAGHTSIVIAHRLSTIKRASRILVMHKGKIREVGNHQQLLAQRGIYWKLYQLQYREQEAEPGRPADAAPSNGPVASSSAAIASQQDLPFDPSGRPDAESAS